MKSIMYIFIITIVLSSCVKVDVYRSHEHETEWTLKLLNNNSLDFITRGHFGNTNTHGNYEIVDDTILLTSMSHMPLFKKSKFIISNNSELLMIENKIY